MYSTDMLKAHKTVNANIIFNSNCAKKREKTHIENEQTPVFFVCEVIYYDSYVVYHYIYVSTVHPIYKFWVSLDQKPAMMVP